MRVISVNIGGIALRENARGKLSKTGISKQPVESLVQVEQKGLMGDSSVYRSREIGDTAVHAFCMESYAALSQHLDAKLPVPCFGENLTVEGYPESEVRIGDVLRIGSVVLHVNQPVVRCSWPSVIAGEPRLLKRMVKSLTTGFYLDVKEPGALQAGDEIELIDRGAADCTVAKLNDVLINKSGDQETVQALFSHPKLAERWKVDLREAFP